MKKISILVPCYNEEENVVPIAKAITEEIEKNLSDYDYELILIQKIIHALCFVRSANLIRKLKQSSMRRILDNSILHIMAYFRPQVIVRLQCAVISKIR